MSPLSSQKATKAKKQVVTETERELVRSGNFDRLVEEQRRKDEERDAEVRRVLPRKGLVVTKININ